MKILKSALSLSVCFLLSSCQAFASFNNQKGANTNPYGKFLLTKAKFGSLLDKSIPTDTWNKYENAHVITVYTKSYYVEVSFLNDGKIIVKSFSINNHGKNTLMGCKIYLNGTIQHSFGLDFLYFLEEDFLDQKNPITPKALWADVHDFESYSV